MLLCPCRFLPQNLKGVLAGFPNEPSAPEHSSSSAADAAADDSEDEDTDGEEDEGGGDSEDDQEGEGLADVAGEDGTEEDTAAAGDSSGRPAAVLLNPVLMVVAGLLDQGYQVRLCLLNAAHYGVPQMRWVSGAGLRGALAWTAMLAQSLRGRTPARPAKGMLVLGHCWRQHLPV